MSPPEVAIVILNWNQAEETLACLSALKSLTYPNYRIMIVDNGSQDGSDRRIAQAYPLAEMIRHPKNVGFAQGCNIGIQKVLERQTPYVLLLNNDTKIDSQCLTYLVQGIEEDAGRGIVGAVNYDADSPERVFSLGHRFIWWQGSLKRLLPPETSASRMVEIQSISGSCFLVRREVFERIGLFDPRFFIYYEETDFCLRAARAGFRVMVHLDAKLWHKGGSTFGHGTPAEYYLFTRNHLLCLVRHCPRGRLPSALAFYLVRQDLRFLLLMLKGRWREAQAVGWGLWDFCLRRFGEGRLEALFQRKDSR